MSQDGETVDDRRHRMDRAISVFGQLLESSPGPFGGSHRDPGAPVQMAQVRAAVAGSFDMYSRLFTQAFDLYEDLVQQALGTAAEAPQDTALVLTSCPGQLAEAPLWIHNSTGADVGAVTVWVTTLTAHDGEEVSGSNGAVTPSALAVPTGESRDVLLTVKVPMTASFGLYHGHVLVTGLPSASLPVRLVVRA